MVLESAACLESTGYSAQRLATRLPRDPASGQLLRELEGDGVLLTPIELAVHARVHAVLGHGAFAAAAVGLIPPTIVPRHLNALDPRTILTSGAVVGQLRDGVSGPPFVALAMNDALVECLVLTWCQGWEAYRVGVRTDTLILGVDAFKDALAKHPGDVMKLLHRGQEPGPSHRSCGN